MLVRCNARLHASLISALVAIGIGIAQPAFSQTDPVSLYRLVVVINPDQLGRTVSTLLSEADASARGASPRTELGNPRSMRLLLPNRRDEGAIASLARSSADFRLNNSIVLDYDDEVTMYRAIMTLIRNPSVLRISKGGVGRYSAEPLVPIVPGQPKYYQWGPYATYVISASAQVGVWAKTRGSAYVAIADNGLQTAGGVHEDLVGSYRPLFSENFGYQSNGPNGDLSTPDNLDETPFIGYNFAGHGTHVTGIVAASNSNALGGAGICPSCSIFAARTTTVLSNPASIVPDFQVLDDAIRSMARRGAQVINFSGGDPGKTQGDYPDTHDALLIADDRDVFVVAASGNGRISSLDFPANDVGLTLAVGGIQADGTFWTGTGTVGVDAFGSNWSSSTTLQQLVAPAATVLSSVYTNLNWNPTPQVECGDDFPSAGFYVGYGQCQGTSMAAPHVAGIVALMRSVDPLKNKGAIRDLLAATSSTTGCTDSQKCQLGVPDAMAAVTASLGGSNVMNRTTPLFSFYSTIAQNHFYTVVPQMAMAALYAGDLLPQPSSGASVRYDQIGSTLGAYPAFPANACGPGSCSNTPKAIASVYTTHVNPDGGPDLVPLYRMSYRCGDELLTTPPNPTNADCTSNAAHISHFYSTDEAAVRVYTGYFVSGVKDAANPGLGYRLDGIEGFVFPTSVPQPSGTVKLCRKYDSQRDDYVLFPGVGTGGTICTGTSDGFTGGNYSELVGGTDWIGWVKLASATIGPTQTNNLPTVSITAPANNAVFSQGASTTVYVSASDSDGSISKVRVYLNDMLLSTDTTSPFEFAWNGMQSGVYVIRALAVDNRGAVNASGTRIVTVNGGPPPSFPYDGGFETPDLPTGSYQANPSGSGFTWSPVAADGQSGITENRSVFNTSTCSGVPCYQDAPNGTQAAFIQGEKIISRQLLFPYGTYKVQFKAAQRRQNFSALGIRVKLDGAQIGSVITPASASFVTKESVQFTVSAGNHTITLEGYNPDAHDNSVFIDKLKIVNP